MRPCSRDKLPATEKVKTLYLKLEKYTMSWSKLAKKNYLIQNLLVNRCFFVVVTLILTYFRFSVEP